MVQLTTILAALALATTATTTTDAHPGQHHTRSLAQVAASQHFRTNAHRSLAACANSPQLRELQQRAAARRLQSLTELQSERERQRRRHLAAADVIATDHKSSLTGVTPTSFDAVALFGATPKCVLEPEVTQGPYYVNGELIRNDVRETQPGVDLYTQLQFIDINSCAPVADYYVDFWHCNSTGVYSGVVANGNGNSNDATNLNATFARGLAPTDADGLVQFVTKFPGHYTGRTTHIHVLGSHGGQVLANGTYAGGGAASVGQIFFDQTLVTDVEKTGVYATNTQTLTTNAQDSIFSQEAATGFDPVVEYVYLGDSVEDGIFSWISVGVDTTISKTVGAAATWTANGGVANANGGGAGGPGGRPGGNGSFPGPPPSGNGSSTGQPPAATTVTPAATTLTPEPTTVAPATTTGPACK